MIDKNKKTILNEGRQVGNPEAMKYGGFPKVSKPLSEAQKRDPDEAEIEQDFEDNVLNPLPKDVHSKVTKHLGKLLHGAPMRAVLQSHHLDNLEQAYGALVDAGHTHHPMTHHLENHIESLRGEAEYRQSMNDKSVKAHRASRD